MAIYKYNLEVDIHDVDYNGIAKASSIMKYIQTAAQSQLSENGMTYEELYGKKRAFLLSRIRIEFDKPVTTYNRLTASSFPCESRGYSFLRCYGLECDGEQVARAVSLWALIDTDTKALVKVSDFELGLATYDPIDLALARFTMPAEITKVGTYTVTYGMTDQNMHMNNTTYPDMYSTFLPLKGKRIKSLSINYSSEAPIGEELAVYRAECGGVFYFRTVRSDGKVNSEAQIELADI